MELLHAIRQHGENRPIIVFSGTIANDREVKELTRLGVSGYLNEYTGAQHIVPALAPHLFPDAHNRRSSPRVGLGVAVSYRVHNIIATGLSLNISTGGLAVRTTNPLEIGATVKLRFRLPKGRHEIEAEARVAWGDRRRHGSAVHPHRAIGPGQRRGVRLEPLLFEPEGIAPPGTVPPRTCRQPPAPFERHRVRKFSPPAVVLSASAGRNLAASANHRLGLRVGRA